MDITEVVLLAVSLAMDAMAVSVCKGLAGGKVKFTKMLLCGVWFGVFQMIMPLIGFALVGIFANYIAEYLKFITPWISFALLVFLGVKMIIEGIKERNVAPTHETDDAAKADGKADGNGKQRKKWNREYGFVTMLLAAIATSIDALAVGVTFAFNGVSYDITVLSNIWLYIAIIGVMTFVISAIGNAIGGGLNAAFGIKFKFIAQILGGAVLIALGIRFLVGGIIGLCT